MNKVPLVWRPLMLRLRWSPTEYSTKVQPPSHLWRRLNDRKRCGSMENACKHSHKSICLWSEIKILLRAVFSIWSSKRILYLNQQHSNAVFFHFFYFSFIQFLFELYLMVDIGNKSWFASARVWDSRYDTAKVFTDFNS